MITIQSGKMIIPEEERFVGFAGDDRSYTKDFSVPHAYDVNDTWTLFLRFDDDRVTSAPLSAQAGGSGTVLTWEVLARHLLKAGIVTAQLKVVSDNDAVIHYGSDFFIVGESTEHDGSGSEIDILHRAELEERLAQAVRDARATAPYIGEDGYWYVYSREQESYVRSYSANNITVDSEISAQSTNPAENRAIKAYVDTADSAKLNKNTRVAGLALDGGISADDLYEGLAAKINPPLVTVGVSSGKPAQYGKTSSGTPVFCEGLNDWIALAKAEDIPTKTSDLTNDSGFLTAHQDISGKVDKTQTVAGLALSGNITAANLKTALSVPTKTSDLTNDSGFLTAHQDITGKENSSNKVTSIGASADNTQYPSALAVKNYVAAAASSDGYAFVDDIPADADHSKLYVKSDGYIYAWQDGTSGVTYNANTGIINLRPTAAGNYEATASEPGALTSGLIPFSDDWQHTSSDSAAQKEIIRARSEVVISGLEKIKPLTASSAGNQSSIKVFYYRADGTIIGNANSSQLASLLPYGASSRGTQAITSELSLPLSFYIKDNNATGSGGNWNNVKYVRIMLGISSNSSISASDVANLVINVPYYDVPGTSGSWVSTGVKHPYYTMADGAADEVFNMNTGQVMYAVGDSITAGYVGDGVPLVDSWVKHVVQRNGYAALGTGSTNSKNLGKSGIGFCHPITENGVQIVAQDVVDATDFSAADIVTVALGVNDWKSLPTMYSLTDFYTAMYDLFNKIRSDNPFCKIYFILPFNGHRTFGEGSSSVSFDTFYWLNTKIRTSGYDSYCGGQTLLGFINLIKAKFEESSFKALRVHLIDMTECEAINRHNITAALADGLHPTAATHIELGKEIARRIVLT